MTDATSKPDSPSTPPASLKGLSNRLKIKSKMVRKIAIMDLIKHQAQLGTKEVIDVLALHLEREDQPALQLRVIEFLVNSGGAAALPLLQKLAADESTDETLKVSLQEAISKIQKDV